MLAGAKPAKVVVGHEGEAKPGREGENDDPGDDNAPENPIRDADNESDRSRIATIAEQVANGEEPSQRKGPDRHDEQAFAARVAQELLFLSDRLCHG